MMSGVPVRNRVKQSDHVRIELEALPHCIREDALAEEAEGEVRPLRHHKLMNLLSVVLPAQSSHD